MGQTAALRHAPVVLVIDDEDYVADMIASALEFEGYTAHVAYNGRDGLARAVTTHCDLIIIDIMMPYLSGTDLVDQIRAANPARNVPIVLISAGARPRQALPNVVFVPKPFDMDQMMLLVGQQLKAAGRT